MLHKGINQKWLVLFVLFKFKEGIYLEVKINREIRNYTESMFFGLSMRQFVFSVLACGVAVGLYFLLSPHVGTETVSWMCVLGAAPFAALGFIRYHGMMDTLTSLDRMTDRILSKSSGKLTFVNSSIKKCTWTGSLPPCLWSAR